MPRTDSLDPQAFHNLGGIDLRKNADQNTALDAVNVHINSRELFVNRLMPALYKDRSQKHMFACEARNLSGADFDYDITSCSFPPSISSSDTIIPKEHEKSFVFRLLGSGLSTVSHLIVKSSDGVKVGNSDFSFIFHKDDDSKSESFLLSFEPSSGSEVISISPFGTCSYIIPEAL